MKTTAILPCICKLKQYQLLKCEFNWLTKTKDKNSSLIVHILAPESRERIRDVLLFFALGLFPVLSRIQVLGQETKMLWTPGFFLQLVTPVHPSEYDPIPQWAEFLPVKHTLCLGLTPLFFAVSRLFCTTMLTCSLQILPLISAHVSKKSWSIRFATEGEGERSKHDAMHFTAVVSIRPPMSELAVKSMNTISTIYR